MFLDIFSIFIIFSNLTKVSKLKGLLPKIEGRVIKSHNDSNQGGFYFPWIIPKLFIFNLCTNVEPNDITIFCFIFFMYKFMIIYKFLYFYFFNVN